MGVYARSHVLVERARRNRSSAGQAILASFAPDLGTPIVSRWFSWARLAVLDSDEAFVPGVVDAIGVPAAMWTVARGSTHVALVVGGPP